MGTGLYVTGAAHFQTVDARSDIYAVGATILHSLVEDGRSICLSNQDNSLLEASVPQ